MVVPPFLLFFIKFFVIVSLDRMIKIAFFLSIFDVFVLFYYFRLVFIKFIIIESRILIYLINVLMIVCILILRNCVAMIVFY